jgi:hypothetical protein
MGLLLRQAAEEANGINNVEKQRSSEQLKAGQKLAGTRRST